MKLDPWLRERTDGAPERLRTRVLRYAAEVEAMGGPSEVLAAAGVRALEYVTSHSVGREVALDLLAADALVTLALLSVAEEDPTRLSEFAQSLLRAESGSH